MATDMGQRRFDWDAGIASRKGLGVSRVTSVAGLSVRSPRNTGWRISPAAVHSVNLTSAMSFGLTQLVLASPHRPSAALQAEH